MPPDPQPKDTRTTGQPSWIAPVMPDVPDHELMRRIGGGSYGDVWLARNVVGTWRAVKVVFRDRFTDARPYEREFGGMKKFEPLSRSNEGFIDILQIGRNDAAGYFYYVMELADDATAYPLARPADTLSASRGEGRGEGAATPLNPDTYVPMTLSKALLQRGRLPASECLELGLTLNLGLAHLHRAGLIHRDIKPSNIIFVNGVPKLADIGLVIETAEARSYVGTEGFIPPEGPNSPQADLYSLGKVLYEAGMGKDRKDFPEPFTQLAESPDATELLEFNAILLKACAANVSERYQSAEEMNADLALLQSGGSVRRQRKLAGQLRFVQRAGVIVTALSAVIALGWWWQAKQMRAVRELATEKSKLADNLARLGEENRNRIVRLDIANGVRLLDEGDPAGALLWFADALPLLTNNPAGESIHRIRIHQTLKQIPRALQVFQHKNQVTAQAMSDDKRRMVTGTEWGDLCMWDTRSGNALWEPLSLDVDQLWQVRFTHSGERVFASSLPGNGFVGTLRATNTAAMIEAETGRRMFALSGTNLLRADLSPNDRWLVTADSDHVIHVYDARDGSRLTEFKGHTDRILQFAFSYNTNVLVSCSEDQTIRLWQLPSGEPIGSPIPHQYGPIALSEYGRFLATTKPTVGFETNTIVQVWAVSSGTQVGQPIEMPGQIAALGFHGEGESALFVMTTRQCGLFDAQTHELRGRIIECPTGLHYFDLSPDGRLIAFAGTEGLQGVWSFETGEQVVPASLLDRAVVDLKVTPKALQLLTKSDDGRATLLSLNLRQEDASHRFDPAVANEGGAISSRRFTPDRHSLLLKLNDDSARMVDFVRMTERRIPMDSPVGLSPIQFRFDASGRRYAIWYSGSGTNVVGLWTEDPRTTNRFVLPHPARLEASMLFTPDGSHLITPGEDHQVRFWRTTDGTLERSVAVPTTQPLKLFPDGRTAFIISADLGRFAFFDLVRGTTTGLGWPPLSIRDFVFSPAGDRFALAGNEKWSRVWSARTGDPLTAPLDHGGEVRWVDWSPDGTRLITAALGPELKIWDASTGEQLLVPLRLGSKQMETGRWSLDGRFIVGSSDENAVRVWDAATGEPVTPILKHEGDVRLAHLVADNRLVTLSLPNVMRAWDLAETRLTTDVIADYAKLVAGRRLNTTGMMLSLKPDELARLSRSLRARAPELFE